MKLVKLLKYALTNCEEYAKEHISPKNGIG